MSRSAYVAHVDKQKRVLHVDVVLRYCPAGALSYLDRSFAERTAQRLQYPKMPLPSETEVGTRHMWSEDYRDKNRINTHESGTAPCKTACPAHIAVQGYLKLAAQGRYTGCS